MTLESADQAPTRPARRCDNRERAGILTRVGNEPILFFLVLDEQQRERAGTEPGVLQIWRKAGTDEVAVIMVADAVADVSSELRAAIAPAIPQTVQWPVPRTWQPDWPSVTPAESAAYGPGTG